MRASLSLLFFLITSPAIFAQGPGENSTDPNDPADPIDLDPPITLLTNTSVADCPKALIANINGLYYYELETCTAPVVTGYGTLPAPVVNPLPSCNGGACGNAVVGTNPNGSPSEGSNINTGPGNSLVPMVMKDKKYQTQVLPANQVIDAATLNTTGTVKDEGFVKVVSGTGPAAQTFYFRLFTIKVGNNTLYLGMETVAPPAGTTVKDATFGHTSTNNKFKHSHRVRLKGIPQNEKKWFLTTSKTERT